MRFLSLLALLAAAPALPAEFLVTPYLQLGDAGKMEAKESMTLLWHSTDSDEPWVVRFHTGSSSWTHVAAAHTMVRLGKDVHRVYREFTTRFVADRYSFTVVDADKKKLIVRQVDDRGAEVDRFVIGR